MPDPTPAPEPLERPAPTPPPSEAAELEIGTLDATLPPLPRAGGAGKPGSTAAPPAAEPAPGEEQ